MAAFLITVTRWPRTGAITTAWLQPSKMSCSQARQAVKASGYYNVVTLDCSGKVYNFSALRKGKQRYVSVNARTGAVWQN